MNPFELSVGATKLTDLYLPAGTLQAILPSLEEGEKYGVIRQWMTEGIPHEFRYSPLLYESLRQWFADRLGIHPKEITLVGSARLGYSCKSSNFGTPFGPHSDLDFTVISERLFAAGTKVFERWKWEYWLRLVKPNNATEEAYWNENLKRVPNTIRRGFINPYQIPNRYVWSKRINQTLWRAKRELDAAPSAPRVKKVSLRVYRDWRAFIKQMHVNLSYSI